jgi:hypothetical protein
LPPAFSSESLPGRPGSEVDTGSCKENASKQEN